MLLTVLSCTLVQFCYSACQMIGWETIPEMTYTVLCRALNYTLCHDAVSCMRRFEFCANGVICVWANMIPVSTTADIKTKALYEIDLWIASSS